MNDVGKPLAMIVGGKYDKKVISVSDKFSKDDEITRDNTEDTILPPDFIPVNEAQHPNPFDTTYSVRTLSPLSSF